MAQKQRPAFDADEYYQGTRMYHRYHIRDLQRFEYSGRIESIHQLSLPYADNRLDETLLPVDDASLTEEVERRRRVLQAAYYDYGTLHSSLKRIGVRERTEYEEYHARHEEPGERLIVKLANTDVANPMRVYRFRVYRWQAGDRDVYLVCTKHKVADHFLKRLGLQRPGWTVQYPLVDLQRMTQEGEGIVLTGTFGDIKGRPNLNSTSLSGYRVNQDAAWIDASKIGQLKTTMVQHKLEGVEVNMMVTNRGSIMIYGVDDISVQLALVTQAYEQVVKKYQEEKLETLTPSASKAGALSRHG